MCGRYTLGELDDDYLEELGVLQGHEPVAPRYNVAPTSEVLVVGSREGHRVLVPMRWGLVPETARDSTGGGRLVNVRSETAARRFRDAFERRRCVIVADGFYEWKATPSGKRPYFVRVRDAKNFGLAGLWEKWKRPDGTWLLTCTVLTTEPNELLAPIHDRMPVILDLAGARLWLTQSEHDEARLSGLFSPFPATSLEAWPVSSAVNRGSSEGAELVRRMPD